MVEKICAYDYEMNRERDEDKIIDKIDKMAILFL